MFETYFPRFPLGRKNLKLGPSWQERENFALLKKHKKSLRTQSVREWDPLLIKKIKKGPAKGCCQPSGGKEGGKVIENTMESRLEPYIPRGKKDQKTSNMWHIGGPRVFSAGK